MAQQISVYLTLGQPTHFKDLLVGQVFVFKHDTQEGSFCPTATEYLQNKIWVKTSRTTARNSVYSMEVLLRELYEHEKLSNVCLPISFDPNFDTYTFDKYNEQCQQTKQDWTTYSSTEIDYCIIAMLGELGEFANKYKKLIRGDYQNLKETYSILLDELGDVLWYFNQLVQLFGSSLAIVAMRNVAKLIKRKEQGTIHNTDKRSE